MERLESLLSDPEKTDWSEFCPDILSINDERQRGFDDSDDEEEEEEEEVENKGSRRQTIRDRLESHGYATMDGPIISTDLITRLREGITTLHYQYGIPATFVFLYDEAWELARVSFQHTLSSKTVTHESHVFNWDVLAWFVPPEEAGFSPHRDRQPEDAAASFHDGDAKLVTHWVALSDATPETSCLYVIPKSQDPGYTDGDGELEDPLRRALSNKESYQHITAVPRHEGQSLLFTHRIIHWGSQNTHRRDARVAISIVSADPSFEEPLLSNTESYCLFPPLRIRLLLVCAQLLIYYQRFNLKRSVLRCCYDYCKKYEKDLSKSYRQKVYVEFVKAMKETAEGVPEGILMPPAVASKTSSVQVEISGDPENEDDEDAMMDAMIDAENGGYGEFEDDYDEAVGEDGGGKGPADDDSDEEAGMTGTAVFSSSATKPNAKKRRRKS